MIPAVRAIAARHRAAARLEREARSGRAARRVPRPPRRGWSRAARGAASCVAAARRRRVAARRSPPACTVDTSLKREFPRSEPVRVDDAAINARFAGTNTLVLLVEGRRRGRARGAADHRGHRRLERRSRRSPSVGKAISYVDFLKRDPPRAERPTTPTPRERARQARARRRSTSSSTRSRAAAEDFDSHDRPVAPRAPRSALLVHERQHALRPAAARNAPATRSRATFPPGYRVRYTGTLASTAAADRGDGARQDPQHRCRSPSSRSSISALLLRSLRRRAAGGAAAGARGRWSTSASWASLGIPLDTMTSAISAMAVGIGADYAIYFLFRIREELATGPISRSRSAARCRRRARRSLFVSSAIACGYSTSASRASCSTSSSARWSRSP